jgi:methylated-DNA-[protein]-cysteine S-methyltransferase
MLGWAFFDTALGGCAIAWGDAGLVGVQLPEADEAATRRRMQQRFASATEQPLAQMPAEVQAAIAGVRALLRGEPVDLSRTRLDMRGVPDFQRRVYELALTIAPGQTLTYGELARRLGEPGAARAVGRALGANPFAPVVPCHRVLAVGGRTGGFSAHGGAATKLRLLAIEGALPGGQSTLF